MRQSWNFRMNPRGRPQRRQRFRTRTPNFGFFFVAAIFALLAIVLPFPRQRANGMPRRARSDIAWASVVADVTIVMFIPIER